jgi:hypothetical protein
MMNMTLVFRTAVVLSPLLAVAAIAYQELAGNTFSQEWRDLIAWDGYGGLFFGEEDGELMTPTFLILVGFVLLLLVNQVALFFYWGPSRWIYLSCIVIAFLIYPFVGITVLTPIASSFYYLSMVLDGLILALAFYSPIAEKFSSRVTDGRSSLPS